MISKYEQDVVRLQDEKKTLQMLNGQLQKQLEEQSSQWRQASEDQNQVLDKSKQMLSILQDNHEQLQNHIQELTHQMEQCNQNLLEKDEQLQLSIQEVAFLKSMITRGSTQLKQFKTRIGELEDENSVLTSILQKTALTLKLAEKDRDQLLLQLEILLACNGSSIDQIHLHSEKLKLEREVKKSNFQIF